MNKCNECTHRVDCTWNGGCEAFELDLADHDKRIRNEVIDEFVDALTCQACFTNMQKDAIRIYAEQMKGELNENEI